MSSVPRRRGSFVGLSATTFLLAFASLFADISTEMLYPVLPAFLTQTLGASPTALGFIDGVAQALQNLVQGLSGWFSDRFRKRKPVALAGYLLAAVSKPLIGLASSWPGVLGARALDRLGAGARSAPRDALVAASADEEHRGKAFGLEGIGDNLGACLGPLITIGLLSILRLDLRSIFYLAIIPGLLAAALVVFVRQGAATSAPDVRANRGPHRFTPGYWRYLGVIALFGVGNSSNAFLILRTTDLGASLTATNAIYAAFNLVAALSSYPAGYLSDTLGRKRVLLLSFGAFIVVYAGFGLATNVLALAVLFALYGAYQGIFRAAGKALATDFLPPDLHASGVGWFSATVGISGLVASVVGGELWTRVGPSATFFFGASFALLGGVAALWLIPVRRDAWTPS